MNVLPGISLYNQDRLSDEDFVANFIARVDLAGFLLDKLRRTTPGGVAEHQLVAGQRGMGKTSLLRRVAIGVARDADLAARYIPLRFREEQYNVLSLAAFWRNCAESLAEWCERNGHDAIAAKLDDAATRQDWHNAEIVGEALASEVGALGRRAILLVDNLDLIVDALPENEQWVLRRALQAPGGPILIGAATQLLRQSGDRDAAFYEFFRPHVLEPLSVDELMRCMRALAEVRGPTGKPVLEILAAEPERLRTLHALTGGNPRVLALIYRLLERAESDSVFADLEVLLDQVTPYYKARVEEYQTKLQRAIIDAVALNWDPITSHNLGQATAIEVTTISSQLNRLRNDGLIDEVPTSGARSGYQLVERFFNIWYLMRHGTRRTKQKMLWLTKFLVSFYRPEELRRIASEGNGGVEGWHPLYREAVVEAVQMLQAAQREPSDLSGLRQLEPGAAEAELRRMIAADPDDLQAISELAILFSTRLKNLSEAMALYDEIAIRWGARDDPKSREIAAIALVIKGAMLGELGRSEEAIAVNDEVAAKFGGATELPLREQVARALVNKGWRLGQLGRSEDAVAVYDDVSARFGGFEELPLRAQVARALLNKGWRLSQLSRSEEALAVYENLRTRFGAAEEAKLRELVAIALVNKGSLLFDLLDRQPEAEAAFVESARLWGSDLLTKFNLAWLYVMSGRVAEAAALRSDVDAVEPTGLALLDAGLAIAHDNFGEAAAALDRALSEPLDGGEVNWFNDLFRLLFVVEARGYGKKLIMWFNETGHAERHAPVHAAFVAYVAGERFLNDVNPEVRQAARPIFRWLADRRRRAEARLPQDLPKMRRGRPARRGG